MRRIAVVGVSGSGKSTFASALSARTGLPLVELDALYWGPNWTPRERTEFRASVARAVAGEAWITDGNYSSARDLVWSAADTLVWLDFGLPLILWRLLCRSFLRWSRREMLWGNNRERLWTHFVTRDSLFLWALQTQPRYRRQYPALLKEPAYEHLALVRLRSPVEARRWLSSWYPRDHVTDEPAAQELIVRCECGFEARGPEDRLVPLVQQHGRESHNMQATREQVLAMARPA